MARISSILLKVSQNAEVSPKYVEKASHSPYSQNELGKSALDFLRFPLLLAFSHKELMTLFEASRTLYGQNDEVSPRCTPRYVRERVARYPHSHRSKLLLVAAPHLAQRGSRR